MTTDIKNLNPAHVWTYFYELTQIPRPTRHTAAVASYVESFGKNLGLETMRDDVGNVLIRKPATAGMEECPIVILQSHLDMVPQKNSATAHNFLTDPIKTRIDGDWVTAIDTTLGADNGIGVAMAMAVLSDTSLVHGPLEALFTVDEEEGMTGAFGLKPDFLKGRILINCDSEEEGQLFVGCAGGLDVTVGYSYDKDKKIPDKHTAIKVSLTGLKGGHSGVDIHLGRANANKLMAHIMMNLVIDYSARMVSFNGGTLRNAIPREAFAVFIIPESEEEDVMEEIIAYQEIVRTEYAGIETGISLVAEKTDMPVALIPRYEQDELLRSLIGCQNGVISMLHDFPDTVQSSSNLAVVSASPDNVEVKFLVRSSSEERKSWVRDSIICAFIEPDSIEANASYNGWKPNIQSPVLKLMRRTYEDLYGKTPAVKVMHAGLECGIIQGIYPDMDMISIGPDLQYPHSPDERVNIASVERTWHYLTETLKKIKNIK